MDATMWDEIGGSLLISDARKLSNYKAQAPSSQTSNQKRSTASGSSISMLDAPVKSKEPEAVDQGLLHVPVPCDKCSEEHPPYSYCPNIPVSCGICYKKHHGPQCPYLLRFPRGADFNPNYEIVCLCGYEFNEEMWFCTGCGGKGAKIRLKVCTICHSFGEHCAHECPENKVAAAECKMFRDKLRSVVPTFTPYVPKSSSYVPTPLSEFFAEWTPPVLTIGPRSIIPPGSANV